MSVRRPLSSSDRTGFTLIELLVVIAIISILASMLMPAFARARESARKIVCTSNMHQIFMASNMYLQDYDEQYPVAWTFWANLSGYPLEPNLKTALESYVKNDPVWWCPSWQGKYGINAWGNPKGGSLDFLVVSDTIDNAVIGTPPYNGSTGSSYSEAAIQAPSSYPLFFCGSSWTLALNAHSGASDKAFFDKDGVIGGTTITFADGHTKWNPCDRNGWNQILNTPR